MKMGNPHVSDMCDTKENIHAFLGQTKLPEVAIFASNDFIAAKKLPLVGLDLMITGSSTLCLSNWASLACVH